MYIRLLHFFTAMNFGPITSTSGCFRIHFTGYLRISSLRTAGPPVLAIAPQESTRIQTGRTAQFTCVASGYPSPEFSWTMDGDQLANGSQVTIFTDVVSEGGVLFVVSILELCSVTVDDSGMYSCIAANTNGNVSARFDV